MNIPISRIFVSFGLLLLGSSSSQAMVRHAESACSILLHDAIKKGNADRLRQLLDTTDISLTAVDKIGNTALHEAAHAGNPAIVAILLDHAQNHDLKVNVKMPDERSHAERIFHYANTFVNFNQNISESRNIDAETAKTIDAGAFLAEGVVEGFLTGFYSLDAGKEERDRASSLVTIPFINIRNAHGATALHAAVAAGHEECVRLLIDRGANFEACAHENKNYASPCSGRPLHLACLGAHEEIAELLIARGADIKAIDGFKRTALHCAALGGSQRLVKLLIDKGLSLLAVDSHKRTPIACAREAGHYTLGAFFLMYKGTKNTCTQDEQLTPMHFAAMGDNVDLATKLEKEGALLHPRDSNGLQPVHHAAQKGACRMLNWCLDRAPFLMRFLTPQEPLFTMAARARQIEAMKVIFDRQKDTGQVIDQVSYLEWAAEERLPECMEAIESKGVMLSAEMIALKNLWKQLKFKRNIVGAYPEIRQEGSSALQLTAAECHEGIFYVIIKSMIAHTLVQDSERCYKALCAEAEIKKSIAEAFLAEYKAHPHEKDDIHTSPDRWKKILVTVQEKNPAYSIAQFKAVVADAASWKTFNRGIFQLAQRNAEALRRGFKEEAPQIKSFKWPNFFSDDEVTSWDTEKIWTLLSASCWLTFKDEKDEIAEDVITLVEKSLIKRIFESTSPGRLSKNTIVDAIKKHAMGRITCALRVRSTGGQLSGRTASECATFAGVHLQPQIAEEQQKAKECHDKAQAKAQQATAKWNDHYTFYNNYQYVDAHQAELEAYALDAEKDTSEHEMLSLQLKIAELEAKRTELTRMSKTFSDANRILDALLPNWLNEIETKAASSFFKRIL